MKKRFIVKRAKKLSYLIINDLNHPLLQDCCDLHFTSPLDITIIFFTKILMILLKEVMIIMVIVAIFINVTILK